ELRTALAFKAALEKASLDEDGFDPDTLHRLRHPVQTPVDADPRLQDPGFKFALRLFVDTTTSSDSTYNRICQSYQATHADTSMPSLHDMKKFVADLTGIAPIPRDMCMNSCVGFTGPWSDLENCPICGEPRYEQDTGAKERKPRRTFDTIPIGPQLVAQSRDAKNAERM
ncbi:uncharacterized protein BXZ73DRAFT_31667, partial [Epithele typhae]|uniref:uncharacterized protein n=1 Tax=Epithele typhae TaxID=378194 RepID=UPI0020088DC6